MSFSFGEFELDQERRQLRRGSEPVPLEPKAYELLGLLMERRPRALSRAQIRNAIWAGTYVSESTLGGVVNQIRQALGDDARQPRFIRTVHGFGYAFCGEVRKSTGDESAADGSLPRDSGEVAEPEPREVEPSEERAVAERPRRSHGGGRRSSRLESSWSSAPVGSEFGA